MWPDKEGRTWHHSKKALCRPHSNIPAACRTGVETPAPLFSLAEAEATLQPGEPQGHRGLPPLAKPLRKRSQVTSSLHILCTKSISRTGLQRPTKSLSTIFFKRQKLCSMPEWAHWPATAIKAYTGAARSC